MRKIAFIIMMLLAGTSYAQHNLYTSNSGDLMDEEKIRLVFDQVKATLPSTYELTAVIYHKIFKKDTVINYINFDVSQRSSAKGPIPFKLNYKQDPLFLLLDQKLPAFKLKDMDGKEVSSADLLGKPTLINFWATSCGPCIAEMPQLSRLKEKYKDKMNFVSITENSAVEDHLSDFLKTKDFTFQVLESGEMYKKALKIQAIPKNLFIDKNGILRYIHGNYPLNANSKPVAIDDKNNYFTKIINELIANAK